MYNVFMLSLAVLNDDTLSFVYVECIHAKSRNLVMLSVYMLSVVYVQFLCIKSHNAEC
jgi:hypothetical protein